VLGDEGADAQAALGAVRELGYDAVWRDGLVTW
jgi:hypothetical protein